MSTRSKSTGSWYHHSVQALKHRSVGWLALFLALWTICVAGFFLLHRNNSFERELNREKQSLETFSQILRVQLGHWMERHSRRSAQLLHAWSHLSVSDWENEFADIANRAMPLMLEARRQFVLDQDGNCLLLRDTRKPDFPFIACIHDTGCPEVNPSVMGILRGLGGRTVYVSDLFQVSGDTEDASLLLMLSIPVVVEGKRVGFYYLEFDFGEFLEEIAIAGLKVVTSKGLHFQAFMESGGLEWKQRELLKEEPALWQQIWNGSEVIEAPVGHYVVHRFSLDWQVPWLDKKRVKEEYHSDLSFYMIATLDREEWKQALGSVGIVMLVVWALIVMLAFVFHIMLVKRITVESRLQNAFEQKNQFLNALLDTLPLPVIYFDGSQDQCSCNRVFSEDWCQHQGVRPGSCDQCLQNKNTFCRSAFEQTLDSLKHSRGQSHTELKIDTPKGEKEVVFHSTVFDLAPDSRKGALTVVVDVTDFRQNERDLVKAKHEADRANNAKSAFLATMSHEIRTPLNGIIGMTSLFAETSLNENQQEYVDTIKASGETLLALINDILDFSKIEADRVELENIPFDLEKELCQILDSFSQQIDHKEVELVYRIAPGAKTRLHGDPTRVKQVFINLIGNAIKFTQQGSVVVEVEPIEGDVEMIEVAVRDTGIGIQQDRIEGLFEPFVQEDTTTTRRYGGTGLGLAICKRLVDLMGGSMRVESEIEKGSVFRFTLPVGKYAPPKSPDNSQVRVLSYLSALVVDDNKASLDALKETLELWNMEVHPFTDAAEALEWLESGHHCDVILTDLWMESMHGDEFGARCRQYLDSRQKGTPILLLSQNGKEVDPLVFNQVLRKPVHRNQIQIRLIEVLSHQSRNIPKLVTSPVPARAVSLSEQYPLRILIAEDNKVNQQVLKLILKKLGYTADVVENGLIALDTYCNAYEENPYDVVLMDIQMPIMDGMQATRTIREFEQDRQCCIVAVTANVLEETREEASRSGFNDYLCKPVKMESLRHSLERSWIFLNRMKPEHQAAARGQFFSA